MQHEGIETGLSEAVDAQLDELLAAWRREHQLTPATVETIRQSILATPDEATQAWWTAYATYLNKVIDQATRHQYGFTGKRPYKYAYQTPQRPKVRLHITPDWQPYLKLT
ncbi:MAG: hypothetical protein U0350_41880 [Caldilineaceae bacterium]